MLGCGASPPQSTDTAVVHQGRGTDVLQCCPVVRSVLRNRNLLWVGCPAAGGVTKLDVTMPQHLDVLLGFVCYCDFFFLIPSFYLLTLFRVPLVPRYSCTCLNCSE